MFMSDAELNHVSICGSCVSMMIQFDYAKTGLSVIPPKYKLTTT